MSFLAPLFLLGALAVALPVLFHLIRRSSRDRIPFSSLMFLLPTPPRVTRRSRLENVLLLLLRCLVICLLASAFARPFFSKPIAPDRNPRAGQKVILLVDTSASMRRSDLWSQARDKVRAALKGVSTADQVACLTFDREVRPLLTFEQWTALPGTDRASLLTRRLDELTPGWGATRLGNALITACESFESPTKDESSQKRIVLVTDLQAGSRLDGLQGFEWPHGIEVSIETVAPRHSSNAGLHLASVGDEMPEKGAVETGPRVRISNASDSTREQFQIGWPRSGGSGFAGPAVEAYVLPGQSRIVVAPKAPVDGTFDRIVLGGDNEPFDNTVYVVPIKPELTRLVFLGRDAETNSAQPLFYLRRAFEDTRRLKVEVDPRPIEPPLTERELGSTRLIVLASSLPDEQAAAVRRFLEEDKAVLVCLQDVSMAKTLGRLLQTEIAPAQETPGPGYAMLAQIDFTHPLFAPFSDPRYSDFTKIHFWKHRRLALDGVANVRVLARFDDGDPALAEIPVGKGKVWVLTSGWQPEESQLALSSKFVPLLYSMLEQSGAVQDVRVRYTVGDVVPLPVQAEGVTIRKPDASEVKLGRREKFTSTDQPGVYTITTMQPPQSFAVNLAPEESKTAPMPIEELERLGLPLQHQVGRTAKTLHDRQEHLQATQLENRQKLWRWLIVATLVVLMLETWLAGRATRRVAAVVPERP